MTSMRQGFRAVGVGLALAWLGAAAPGQDPQQEGIEFFEKRVRPVLAQRCHECHSTASGKDKGGLLLDSRQALLDGGDSGPAIVPGDAAASLLVRAIRWEDKDLQMPPKAMLPQQEREDLERWIAMGAPWPAGAAAARGVGKEAAFDLQARKASHWAWQPVARHDVPAVRDEAWPAGDVDRFLLARIEAAGLEPSGPADRATLIRRASFVLTGLPPGPAEVRAFEEDRSEDAWERVVDRLLASPHFGERWARHWLDLVRYSETLGHEFDFELQHAWRYRDYVVRAFNADVPYDQFVREHIAGDLFDVPRRDPVTGADESMVATTFWWLGQRSHSPVDVRASEAEYVENQIDVLGKAFLGLTVACARCHDHKFDAISTEDYYALYGVMSSTRPKLAPVDPPSTWEFHRDAVGAARDNLVVAALPRLAAAAQRVDAYLLEASRIVAERALHTGAPATLRMDGSGSQLDGKVLQRWVDLLQSDGIRRGSHPAHVFHLVASAAPLEQARRFDRARAQPAGAPAAPAATDELLGDFTKGDLQGWTATGAGFVAAPAGSVVAGEQPDAPIVEFADGATAHSGTTGRRLQSALRSPTREITRRYLHVRLAGRSARVNAVVDGFTLIQYPIYGELKQFVDHPELRWFTFDLGRWKGRKLYVELLDQETPDPADKVRENGYGPDSWIAVQQAWLSDEAKPPAMPSPTLAAAVHADGARVTTVEELARGLRDTAVRSLHMVADGTMATAPDAAARVAWLNLLVARNLLPVEQDAVLASAREEFALAAAAIPSPQLVHGAEDGGAFDEPVFVRGNHAATGPVVPRGFLTALETTARQPVARGSGRSELADRIADPDNPLTARVMANRVFHHVFGRGLVASVDDFGALGEEPTHPELLDWLALRFVEQGWSVKALVRELLLSRAFRTSSAPASGAVAEVDPENLLLSHMRIRRLEGEAVRDALLRTSGRLDPAMGGPSVGVHLTAFMEGRGRPGSGPLDGDGRRSLYVEVRRNFLPPMMLAFDVPLPSSTVGRRTVSNVPAQALILMNDPFVLQQARHWAARLLAEPHATDRARIAALHREALAREPRDEELDSLEAFVREQSRAHPDAADEAGRRLLAFTDLCHVVFNLKEFVFVP